MSANGTEHLTPTLSPERRGSEALTPGAPERSRDEFLTKQELAARLKVTERSIENWQRQGVLPYLKISNVVLFHWPEIVAHLNTHFKVNRRGLVRPRVGTREKAGVK